eukprot:1535477-Karenia_brevis.AAC.1
MAAPKLITSSDRPSLRISSSNRRARLQHCERLWAVMPILKSLVFCGFAGVQGTSTSHRMHT